MADAVQQSRFRSLLREGQTLGHDLERGQASSPLAEFFETLGQDLDRQPLTVAVVPLEESVRADALAWLLGEPFRTVSSRLGSSPGLTEVRLSERGFALERPDGARQEFDALADFLSALSEHGAAAEPGDGLTLDLGTGAERPSAHLLIADSLAATAEVPGLASMLITRCQLLLLVLGPRDDLSGLELERIGHLTEGVGAVWPITGAEKPGNLPRALSDVLARAVVLPVQTLPRDPPPPTPFVPPYDGLHGGLVLAHACQRLTFAVAALAERQETEFRQGQVRKTREERSARPDAPLGVDAGMRRPFDLAKQRLQDDITQLGKSVVETGRRSLLSDGRTQRAIADTLATLRAEDLRQDPGEKMVRLSLTTSFQDDLQRAIKKAFKEDLRQDLVTLRDGLEALRGQLEAGLEQSQTPVSLALTPPSESDVWNRMSEMVSMDIRYRGEMPRRGFFQRLGEGRRAVFGVMMILSLVGSMVGFSWRGLGLLGLAFLFMFIGVVIYTYRAWKREDAEKIGNEIDRVREQLTNECRRLAVEVQRDKQQRLAEVLEQSKRQVIARLDDLLRDRLQLEQSAVGEQREKARLRLRKIDQQLRDLQQLGLRIAKLRSDTLALGQEVQRGLREAVRKLPAGTP